jgi:hypothetical protein
MNQLLALALCLCGSSSTDQVAALRSEGPVALARLLERYRSEPPGPAHDTLEATIDAVAAQRYATFSGLYWYTDLARAEEAARASGKPILSLRMLGRLDEDLSCANSRFFRVALYANASVSAFLRDNFVLHWSSERPVPKVTIDFGDGRAIHTTLAGNSAHYVLDADGRVIDVLPGLYSPVAFQRELEALLPLASMSPTLGDTDRDVRIREEIAARDSHHPVTWPGAAYYVPPNASLLPDIAAAEATAFSKSLFEMPMLPGPLAREMLRLVPVQRLEEAHLDASSRALFARLAPADLAAGEVEAMRAAFESSIAADTQMNELQLRPQIHRRMLASRTIPSFEVLNRVIYDEVFLTPSRDPWLGLRTEGFFSALPNGGISR